MTLAVMGYHLQVMTRKLSKAMDKAVAATRAAEIAGELPEKASGD